MRVKYVTPEGTKTVKRSRSAKKAAGQALPKAPNAPPNGGDGAPEMGGGATPPTTQAPGAKG
jgi:hypothetical protein